MFGVIFSECGLAFNKKSFQGLESLYTWEVYHFKLEMRGNVQRFGGMMAFLKKGCQFC